MSPLFEIAELLKIGVEDEISGVAFYGMLAEKTKNPAMRKVYASLADQERYHQERFQKMLDELGEYEAPESYSGEYVAYLRALLDSRAFKDPETAKKLAAETPDDKEAIKLAIRFERDTLGLMNELRDMVPKKDQDVVDNLAREEQAHLVELTRALESLI